MNGGRNDLPGRDVDKRAILEEGGIQRGEGIVRAGRAAGEMLFDQRGMGCHCRRQAADDDAVRLGRHGRQVRRIVAVDEDQAGGGQEPECEAGDGFPGQVGALRLEPRLERQLGDGGHVGEAPVLVLEGWKPEFGKTVDASPPPRRHP